MQEFATQVVDLLNGLIWGKILIWLLVGCGLYFTVRLGLIQFRHFGHTFSVLKGSRQSDDSGISSFQALCTSLAARVGTGNVAGVAVAITLGGPGAVFWMWAIALVGMATGFVEATLAQLFKIRDDKGQFRGGPAYYMEKGLGARWMGILFSIFLIIAFGFVFNSVQANTITGAMQGAFGVPTWISGIAVVILTALIIFGGLRSIEVAGAVEVAVELGGFAGCEAEEQAEQQDSADHGFSPVRVHIQAQRRMKGKRKRGFEASPQVTLASTRPIGRDGRMK